MSVLCAALCVAACCSAASAVGPVSAVACCLLRAPGPDRAWWSRGSRCACRGPWAAPAVRDRLSSRTAPPAGAR